MGPPRSVVQCVRRPATLEVESTVSTGLFPVRWAFMPNVGQSVAVKEEASAAPGVRARVAALTFAGARNGGSSGGPESSEALPGLTLLPIFCWLTGDPSNALAGGICGPEEAAG